MRKRSTPFFNGARQLINYVTSWFSTKREDRYALFFTASAICKVWTSERKCISMSDISRVVAIKLDKITYTELFLHLECADGNALTFGELDSISGEVTDFQQLIDHLAT